MGRAAAAPSPWCLRDGEMVLPEEVCVGHGGDLGMKLLLFYRGVEEFGIVLGTFHGLLGHGISVEHGY